MSLQFLCFCEIIFRVRLYVWNLNRTALQQRTTHRGSPPCADWRACPELQATWRGIVNSGGTATVAIVAENHAVLGTANAHGILQQVSRTRWRSNTVRLMVLSTSAVAVCCRS